MTRLSHVSLVVPNLDQAMKRMQEVYGLTLSPVMVNVEQGVKMAYIELGNARIELMEPQPSNPSLMRFLERHPQGGLHHLALGVDSVAQTCQSLQTQGVAPISAPEARNVHGQAIAFIHPRDFLGALLELEEAHD
ncbi:MAG: hypothetical protein RIT26_1779 [Pseudomonadota bacterium]|jgi:methylmalonyl-CoA/ethylmalonyl-CoA epimerase